MASNQTPGVFFKSPSNGETARLIQEIEWSNTPLGPRQSWPRSLNNYLGTILELPTAAIIFWGADQIQLYNDGYAVIMGPRHPKYLGASFRACWPEAYDTIHPWMQRVLAHGETVEVNRSLVPLTRHGFVEECYFTFSFSPLRDDEGRIAGILQLVTEVTAAVLAERRSAVLHQLSNRSALARTPHDAMRLAAEVLGECTADVPFTLVYVVDPFDDRKLSLEAASGPAAIRELVPQQLDVGADSTFPELSRVVSERVAVAVEDVSARLGPAFSALWPQAPATAIASPIAAADPQQVAAVFVAGVSPQLELDTHYREFLELVAAQLASSIAAARAHDDERKRVAALAELDREKTEFFGNVSHELRTPLTLILGPLEDALAEPSKSLQGDRLEAVHRNALRLLRLVNTLLDFTRLEANRLTPTFEPTDLAMLTAGLVGSFQSLMDSAALSLRVECSPLSEPAYIDRSQWEKIVFNLISNAFKFTLEGGIAVRLHESEHAIHLAVSDTGTGIPLDELPKLFRRFHRVRGARGRSYEGTGIGLALVRELVTIHGGTVAVESAVGRGSTFSVTIPRGAAHLPTERIAASSGLEIRDPAASYVSEAAHWGPSATGSQQPPAGRSLDFDAARILVADDNADMREYLVRLLSQRWRVEAVEDGNAALEAATAAPPDLVLSDVMMPNLDGIALLKALRANANTSMVPVILLSARAGEEAVVGGLETGADDYLIKPFSARELLGRVGTHLEMARLRRKAVEAAQELADTRAVLLEDLDRKNRELETFSYSVSHDLRAPIRAIEGFSQVVLEDHGGELGLDGKDSLTRVISAARRMNQLIDDLLLLSRIERQALTRSQVDVSAMARQVLAELAATDRGRAVEVTIADSLTPLADEGLVRILLDNVLGNAWKFTAKTAGARIEVGRMDRAGEPTYFVTDNGAGFDAPDASRLFTPFQRFHSQHEFSGTGVGLATVRRIVERHGGRVWVESRVGHGTTVYWTFPIPRDITDPARRRRASDPLPDIPR